MYAHHIFVCTNQKSGVGDDVAKTLKKELKKQDLKKLLFSGKKRKNRIQTTGCLDVCKHCKKGHGTAIVFYPENIWYGDVQPQDVPDLVAQHLGEGQPVRRLRLE